MRRAFFSLVIVITCVFAAGDRPGATFLLIPPTAKATGMGYAWTAIADDASANYYNAAGLAFLESPEVCLSYFKYVPGLQEDMPYFYGAAVLPLNNHAWGVDVVYFEQGKTEVTNEQGQYLGTYALWRLALKANYARSIFGNLACGIGLKYVHLSLTSDIIWLDRPPWFGDYSVPGVYDRGTATSWAFDFNVLYRVMRSLSVGAVLHNLGPKLKLDYLSGGSGDPLPLVSRLGLAYRPLQSEFCRATLCGEITKVLVGMFADEDKSFLEQLDYELYEAWKGIGLEFTFFKILSLRGGHFWDVEGARRGFTFGGGVRLKKLELDIGIDENIFDFPTTNRKVSLSYTF